MEKPNELTRDAHSMSKNVNHDQSSTLPPTTQVNKVHAPPLGPKGKSIAALDAAIVYEIRMGTLDPNMDKKQMRRLENLTYTYYFYAFNVFCI